MRPRVVAIDGAAGSGKTTLARPLAAALGLPYVNTGLMYRAVAAAAIRAGADPDDAPALASIARGLRFRLRGTPGELEVEGSDARELQSTEVEDSVSAVARHPEVRALMRDIQRSLGAGGAVMEGRDIATVVFPDAPVKIFLTASAPARASRRSGERDAPGDAVARDLHARDRRDARVNPLEPAPDAVVIDTTDATPEQTLARALEVCRERSL